MASEAAEYIDRLIRNYIHPLLKGRGFRRQGRTWNRPGDGLVQVVNIQGSARNVGDQGWFYLNLGIFVPGLAWEGVRGEPAPFMGEGECQLRLRIEEVMPVRKGSWRFSVSDDLDELGRSATDALLTYGLPFLDQGRSPKDLDEYLDANDLRFHFHAALTAYRGQREAARDILLRASAVNPSYQRAAQWAADVLGIDLGPTTESGTPTHDG